MATGSWNENNRPTIPGWYNRFKNNADERIGTGIHGVLAMPIKANWGPVKTVTTINKEKELINNFGSDINFTAYKLGRLALLGQPKELLLYRLVDGSEKTSTLTLKNSEVVPADVIKLESKYPTTRLFNVTIRTNIANESKKDFLLFEGTKQIFSISALSGTIDEIVNAINKNSENDYIVASKVSGGTGILANVVNAELTGGNDGTSAITNEHYLDAMSTFEGYGMDGFVLDGVTDEGLQASVKYWIIKNKEEGNNIIAFVGGGKDDSIEQANSKSKEFNHEDIVNVFCKASYEGDMYNQAEIAVYIAALATGKGLKDSICNAITIFDDVSPRLSKADIENALSSGTLVLAKDADDVIVVDDVNTYKNYTDEKGEVFGSIRAVKFMNAVDGDTSLKRKEFVGKTSNNDTGRTLILCALKQYFETLYKAGVIDSDFTVEIDKELQANAQSDEFFWKWSAKYVDVIKRIYGTGNVTK
ncbi:phage tail sheath subtilisin-like domain-containing protein [Clostridium saccharobutylicum]|uniref:Phage tail sheath protein n=1 Tax=Clostridium saccharobutylicum DSM 13864 TaxID=1345695 RepID=U5MY09_CLOSA|nr:phage tail sheath subtilisin-like domain-containing protein [Clostridium saccharobutylicum]AGX44511.1 phage tail sheath protein [Clostridium saccharobutylicum DSM 13864]AQR91804.1 phage tail sheath protein [Clostridium saccharobutylicum]AQS01706.1 phage tail sheath protein [Clostridium saccharobutylicum]AQS11312.1 phage tail sheath protein [Clostridium saccharobutylicum]AQS15689.1 phage tail sheath protein [Clostridium saccharobutylicum]